MSEDTTVNQVNEEVIEKSKQELFAENPDRFEDLKNCLLVVKRDPETKQIMILNQCTNIEESFIVDGYIKDGMTAYRTALRVRQAQTGIVKPTAKNPGFLKGLANHLR